MPLEESKVVTASSASARIIAVGIVFAFCYFASTVLVTLLMAVLLAYFLDPVVTWLERVRIPSALGIAADGSVHAGAAGGLGLDAGGASGSIQPRLAEVPGAAARRLRRTLSGGWKTSRLASRKLSPAR